MSATQPPSIQTTFGSTDTTQQQGDVTVDITGDVQYPSEVAGYELLEDSYQTVYAAPTGQTVDKLGSIRDEYVLIGIKSVTLESGYAAKIEVGNSSFDGHDDIVVATGETELAAAREAVKWMKAHPAPEADGVYRPAFGEGESADREPMRHKDIGDQVERIRVGSVVEIDSLPPVQVTAEVDTSELDTIIRGDVFTAETPNGDTLHLVLGDKISYSEVLSYSGSVDVNDSRVVARHVTVSNETNLRESVDTDQYEWLKARQGEKVVKKNTDTTFQVVEVDELRDGFLNPSGNDLDPEAHHTSGTYIDGSNEWFDNVAGMDAGTYRITKSGVVELSDKYAGHVVVDAEKWNAAGRFTPTDTYAVDTVEAAPENVVADDREGLSRTDSVSDITGVGSATEVKFWKTNVSELYRQGFPAVHIPAQYHEEAIADMYALPSFPTEADAARAVVGILGGAAFNDNGERIGSVASMISDKLNPDDMVYGWLSNDHDHRIKGEYTPTWVTNTNTSPAAVGAGAISVKDIRESHGRDVVEPVQATAIRQNLEDDDLAAVMTDEGHVEVDQKPLKVMATVANVDLQKVGGNPEHTISVLHAGGGDGVLVLNNTSEPYNAVIDTEGKINPEKLRRDTGE